MGRKYVLPPDDYHVVGTPVDSGDKGGVSAPAGAVDHVPAGDVPRPVANHGLGRALQVGIDRYAFAAQGDRCFSCGVHHFRVDQVQPQVHPTGEVAAPGIAHPGRHLGHSALVNDVAAEGVLDFFARGGHACAGFTGEEHQAERKVFTRVEAHPLRGFSQVEGVGGRGVQRRRLDHGCPLDRSFGLTGRAASEGKAGGSQSFGPYQCAPTADVQAEHRRDHHTVRWTQADAP